MLSKDMKIPTINKSEANKINDEKNKKQPPNVWLDIFDKTKLLIIKIENSCDI